MADDRFVKIYSQGNGLTSSQITVFVDKVTGVNYLFHCAGYAGGLSPLLDKDGKPVRTMIENK